MGANFMKKITIFVIILAVIIVSAPITGCTNKDGASPGPDRPDSRETTYERNPDVKDPLLIGVPNVTLPPMIMWDKDGNLTGFEIEFIEETAKRLGVSCEIVPINPGTEGELLGDGTIDCAWGNISETGATEALYNMTGPYITIPQAIAVYEGSGIIDKKDIKNAAVIMSTPAESLADGDKLGINLDRVSASRNYEKTFEQLAEGHVAAAVCDMTVAVYMQNLDGKIKILENDPAQAQYSVAFRQTDEKMMKAADNVLKDILGDGTLTTLSLKWFGQDYIK